MDVAQGQIVRPAQADLLPGDGAVAAVRAGHVAVEAEEVDQPVRGQDHVGEDLTGPVRAHKGRAVDHAPQIRQGHRPQLLVAENMYVLRPDQPLVGTAGGEGIMVARGDEHRAGHPGQGGPQPLQGLRIDPLPIEEVPAQEHRLRPLPDRQLRQPVHQVPALPPALPGLLRAQAAEGAVQVEVRSMYDLRHGSLLRLLRI